ncbi:shikimate dehydrogenase family protein [Fuscibacter oryzae]|uniref:Shikimate dehydrogenase n=1 Tax=Fuscibacter oryzae TaxID=2803939 RepID=A0A8J7MWJ3_9RHOB|nr:shikimate dehydrogenase [Fuscibacter oryzae]MBL4930160.1 shikimate dehydrogenase [Fuscibacter oryzae]
MRGSAKADVFAMLAHPIGHAKSPGMFNALFEERGLDSLMMPITCAPGEFDTLWAGLTALSNLRGVIISIPYKVPALAKAETAHPRAARVGAANILRRLPSGGWEADNFDGFGFVLAMKKAGHTIAGQRVLQVGAGGAGCSIAHCLAEEGATSLTISDIDENRAKTLAAAVQAAFPACQVSAGSNDPAGMSLVVNATPVGMKPTDPLPLPVEALRPGMIVADIIMEPAETRLLAEARARGCQVQPGQPMMDCQMQGMADFLDVDRKNRNV